MRFAVVLFCALFFGPAAAGCAVCVSKPLKFAFQDSELFFVGKVTQRQPWTVTFQVLEQFHGGPVSEVTLQTSSSCALSHFTVGTSYMVEATAAGDGLLADLCSHTHAVEDAARKLELVRRRANWWKCPLSRVSFYRFRHFLGRHLAR